MFLVSLVIRALSNKVVMGSNALVDQKLVIAHVLGHGRHGGCRPGGKDQRGDAETKAHP